ncbi:MAG TPA: class I adenylate-forming enzyme family protein [Natronosporangium sp.]|nr:class I adenylate-forming enzyme family protein [Natronosporangium sp.]
MLAALTSGLRRDADRPAFLGRGQVTRGELADLADGYAAALYHDYGLGPGDPIGVAVRPGARAVAVMLAAYRLGLQVVVLDPTAGPEVLRSRLARVAPRLILADAAAQAVAGWAAPLARRAHLALPDLESLGPVVTVGPRLPGCAPPLSPVHRPVPDHRDHAGDAVVIFTSGTTSRPRAVVHTRASLNAGLRAVRDLVEPIPGQPVLGGTFFVLLPALAAGAPVVLPARSTRQLVRQLRRFQPQATYLTPPVLRDVLAAGGRFTGRVWTGSAPASASLLGRVRQAGAEQAWGVYALTELFPAAAVEAREKQAFREAGDLVGALLPGVRGRVDETGQVWLTGPSACHRYLGEAPQPWVATGDLGRFDAQGRLVLAGRCKDMILRRAENIYPGLYEPLLHVPGVDLAVLVGVPDSEGDERLVALIQLAPGADPTWVRAALERPLARMGAATPDVVRFTTIPLAGRSRKPDRAAAARLAATLIADTEARQETR